MRREGRGGPLGTLAAQHHQRVVQKPYVPQSQGPWLCWPVVQQRPRGLRDPCRSRMDAGTHLHTLICQKVSFVMARILVICCFGNICAANVDEHVNLSSAECQMSLLTDLREHRSSRTTSETISAGLLPGARAMWRSRTKFCLCRIVKMQRRLT